MTIYIKKDQDKKKPAHKRYTSKTEQNINP